MTALNYSHSLSHRDRPTSDSDRFLTMYGAIPDVVITKPPRNNQFRVVVALVVGVMIGALGTAAMLFPVVTKNTEAPTPAPRPVTPILAADPEIEMSDDLMECKKQLKGVEKQAGSCYMQLMTCIEST